MPSCCIVGCRGRIDNNQPKVTLHKLPKSDDLKNKWLQIIGTENINPRHKKPFVCSLHFEESCFNRTLDQIRLRDDSVPSSTLLPKRTNVTQLPIQSCVIKSQPSIPVAMDSDNERLAVSPEVNQESDCVERVELTPNMTFEEYEESATIRKKNKQIEKLRKICLILRKRNKLLLRRLGRRDRKISYLSDIVKGLRKKKGVDTEETEEAYVLVVGESSVECRPSLDLERSLNN